ncbi:hypothetical protein R3I93_011366 [Phoxinus phoxinus]|uniref:Uncharacterized protein n=1 Tax=Phoxinus phoxinus TaxID=58324 RepID=A0AAN9H5F3_9TELE
MKVITSGLIQPAVLLCVENTSFLDVHSVGLLNRMKSFRSHNQGHSSDTLHEARALKSKSFVGISRV